MADDRIAMRFGPSGNDRIGWIAGCIPTALGIDQYLPRRHGHGWLFSEESREVVRILIVFNKREELRGQRRELCPVKLEDPCGNLIVEPEGSIRPESVN